MLRNKVNELFNSLLKKSELAFPRFLLQEILNRKISFNAPHKFKFIEMSEEYVTLMAPFVRSNKNHLGGVHACTVATIGEYSAGLTLLKNFGVSDYRIIMKELSIKYTKQATGEVFAKAYFPKAIKEKVIKELREDSKSQITLESGIYNHQDEKIANVTTSWQIKNWDKVKFRT